MTISAVIVIFVFASLLIRIIFGPDYSASTPILRILLVGYCFSIVYIPFSFIFYAFDDSRTRFILELVKFILAVILLFILVPSFQEKGAAFALAITMLLNMMISLFVLRRKIRNNLQYSN